MRRLLAAVALSFAVACGGDSSTAPPAEQLAGTWTLQTVNGAPLPFVIAQSGTNTLEVLSDVFVIASTGTFTQTTTFRSTVNGVVTTDSIPDTGSYTQSGTTLSLHFNGDGSSGTASWSGNTLTASTGGITAVYKR